MRRLARSALIDAGRAWFVSDDENVLDRLAAPAVGGWAAQGRGHRVFSLRDPDAVFLCAGDGVRGVDTAVCVRGPGRGQVLELLVNVRHGAEALETTVILDVFSPPSEKTGVDEG